MLEIVKLRAKKTLVFVTLDLTLIMESNIEIQISGSKGPNLSLSPKCLILARSLYNQSTYLFSSQDLAKPWFYELGEKSLVTPYQVDWAN